MIQTMLTDRLRAFSQRWPHWMYRSAQARAVVFVVLVCCVLLGMTAWSTYRAHNEQLRDATVATNNMAASLAQHAHDAFLSVDTVLLGLEDRTRHHDHSTVAFMQLQQWLQKATAQLGMFSGIFVSNAKGEWIVTSYDRLPDSSGLLQSEYFQYHQHIPNQGLHISAPVQSVLTRKWVIPVSRRLNSPDGTFSGIALAMIDMDYFAKYYAGYNIGNSGIILLASGNGTVLARKPFDTRVVGQNVTSGPIFTRFHLDGPGTTMITSTVDSVDRLVSYRMVERYSLLVAVALSNDEIFSYWRQAAYRTAGVTALLIGMLGMIGARLTLQIGLRERTQVALREAQTALETVNRSLHILSFQDSLTGLGNRRQFDLELARAYRRGRRNKTSMVLIMIDVDYFKRFNDLYGHPVGDSCLRTIGERIKGELGRANDVAMRYGGEELAVVMSETGMEGALVVAERIRAAIEAAAIPHAGNPFGIVTVSLGVATGIPNQHDKGELQLAEAADRALYRAKDGGRNCVRSETIEDAV